MRQRKEGIKKKVTLQKLRVSACISMDSQQITAISVRLPMDTAGHSVSLSVSLTLSGKGCFQMGGSVVAVHQRRTACCYQIFIDGSGEDGRSSWQNVPSVGRQMFRPKKSVQVRAVIQKLKKYSG